MILFSFLVSITQAPTLNEYDAAKILQPVISQTQNIRDVEGIQQPKPLIAEERMLITTPILYKSFLSKAPNNQQADNQKNDDQQNKNRDNNEKELMIRYNNRYYLVKFCESKVSRSDVENIFENDSKNILKRTVTKQSSHNNQNLRHVTLDISLKEGLIDHCSGDPIDMQSRLGKYAIIHAIIGKSDK